MGRIESGKLTLERATSKGTRKGTKVVKKYRGKKRCCGDQKKKAKFSPA